MFNQNLSASHAASFVAEVVAAACRLSDTLRTACRKRGADVAFAQSRTLALRLAVVTIAATRGRLSAAQQESYERIVSSPATARELQELLGSLPGAATDIFSNEMIPDLNDWMGHPESLGDALKSLAAHTLLDDLPVEVIGRAYQALLDIHPTETGFEQSKQGRKAAGKFYTPPALVDYIVRNTVGVILGELASDTRSDEIPDRLLTVRVLDPSSGCGDFLLSAARLIGDSIASHTGSEPLRWRRAAVEQCVYGVDSDPTAVSLARLALWLECGLPGEGSEANGNIHCADSLKAITTPRTHDGFHAVIGNPPYVASKNQDMSAYQEMYDFRGQSDYYLLFLANLTRDGIFRPDGYLSMVLPDPFIVRSNAAQIRRRLIGDWTMESLLHTKGMFPGAGVSNAVPVCRRRRSSRYSIAVKRVDSAHAAKTFTMTGCLEAAQVYRVESEFILSKPGAEILYMAGDAANLMGSSTPCSLLEQMDVKIGRGEEIGKSHLCSEEGEFPVLLGGQSVSPFHIRWEGRRIDRARIKKPLHRYLTDKIVVQKSSGKLIAALDETTDTHTGFVAPQSIYCIRSGPGGPRLLYLLALLNSSYMNDYVFRMFTGYKLIQPQIEIEDLKRLPIRDIRFAGNSATRQIAIGKIWPSQAVGPARVLQAARQWLDMQRDDLLHDLIVAITHDVVKMELTCPDRDEVIRLLDSLVSMLYGLPERVVL